MRRSSLLSYLLLLVLTVISIIEPSSAENNKMVSLPASLCVNVERKIALLSGGYIMINDTFSLSSFTEINVTNYVVGIPKNYSDKIIYYRAYDSRDNLPIAVSEDEKFTWLNISFLEAVSIDGNKTYSFTVTTVFSDLINRISANIFHAVFPLYPSLTSEASFCNVTLVLPSLAEVSKGDYPGDVFTNKTSDFRILYNVTRFLQPYADFSSWVEFSDPTFQILKFLELKREISIDSWGKISVTDFYEIEKVNAFSIDITLPSEATDISVYDAYGKYPKGQMQVTYRSGCTVVRIYLSEKLEGSERIKIAVSYILPPQKHLVKNGWQNYMLNINLTRPDVWVVYRAIIAVTLPEGASLIRGDGNIYAKSLKLEPVGLFQEKVIIECYKITKFEDLSLSLKYQYMIFWAAFRPTLFATAIVGLLMIISFLTKLTGKVGAFPLTSTFSELLKKFLEICEEKGRIVSEIEFLEQQSMKGKISRKQYMLTRKTLEDRLASLQKSFLDLKTKIENTGGRYTDIIRRLEAAEADIEAARRNMSYVEIQYRRGEIPAETRRKLLEEYKSRKEKAENIREEILLRLKEEIL